MKEQTSTIELLKQRFEKDAEYIAPVLNQTVSILNKPSAETFGAIAEVDEEGVADAADVAVQQWSSQTPRILEGIPIAIKDNFVTQRMATRCGSKILKGYRSPYDATVVQRLKAAGAVIVAKTSMDEFGMGSSTEHNAYGPACNPYDIQRVPGGSSGGSAVVASTGWVPAALGSDTGGSVRQPASFCGVVGLKPTYGALSRYGLVAFASSLDCPGIMARYVHDCKLVFDVVSGHDPKDGTSIAAPSETAKERYAHVELKNLRVGILNDLDGSSESVLQVLQSTEQWLESKGATTARISMPELDSAIPCYYVLASAEASSNLSRYDGVRYGQRVDGSSIEELMTRSRSEGFGDEVKRRIVLGTFALATGYYDAYYAQAAKVRRLIHQAFQQRLSEFDVLLMPTAPSTAFRLGEQTQDALSMYLSDRFTVGPSLAGVPSISVPSGFDHEGLPIGMQWIGKHHSEYFLMGLASRYESDHAWSNQFPKAPRLSFVDEGGHDRI